jgi:hypothetical protein
VKRRRAGEDLELRRSTGRKRRILATPEEKRALWAQLEEHDEATPDLAGTQDKKVRELIEGRDRHLVFLPSYSADFNPIDQAFSKIQVLLRKAKARSFGRWWKPLQIRDAAGPFVMKTALSDPGGAKDSRSPCPPAWTCLYHFANRTFDEDAPIQDSIAACANIEFDAMSPLASLTRSHLKNREGGDWADSEITAGGIFSPFPKSDALCSYVLASRPGIYEMSTRIVTPDIGASVYLRSIDGRCKA